MTAFDRGLPAGVPRPVADLKLMGGTVWVLAFGKPHDWSLASYNAHIPLEERHNPDVETYLPVIAACAGLGKILHAPSPRLFNAEIATENEVMKTRYCVESQEYHDSVWIDRGRDADGMLLPENKAYIVSPAGCPVAILKDDGGHQPLGVTHAGMRSIINESRLERMLGLPVKNYRRHESVLYRLLEKMRIKTKRDAKRLQAAVLFPIDPSVFTYPWDHPAFGALNRLRSEDIARRYGAQCVPGFGNKEEERLGRIDLGAVCRAQLMLRGVLPERITVVPSPPRE